MLGAKNEENKIIKSNLILVKFVEFVKLYIMEETRMRSMVDGTVFGRDELIDDVLGKLKDGVSVVLHGEEKSGKSAVLRAILKELCNRPIGRVCSLTSVRNEKGFLQEMGFQLRVELDETRLFSSNTGAEQLSALVRSEFRRSSEPILIFADGVNSSLPPKTVEALGMLLSMGGILVIATRSLDVNKDLVKRLKPVEVKGLLPEDASLMIEELAAEKSVEDIPFLEKQLYKKTRGFPGLIKEAMDGFTEERITKKKVEGITVQVSEQVKYMYVFFSILLIGFLFANKYMSRLSTFQGGRVDYALGAMGMVVALIFRFAILPYLKKQK